jgi:hypothetical protein
MHKIIKKKTFYFLLKYEKYEQEWVTCMNLDEYISLKSSIFHEF